jgi:hypothetical protein
VIAPAISPRRQRLATAALSVGSVLSLPAALTEMVPRPAAALDDDPATVVSPGT